MMQKWKLVLSAAALLLSVAPIAADPLAEILAPADQVTAARLQSAFERLRIPTPPALEAAPGARYRVDLFTMEAGEEAYSAWGHTALRILDVRAGRDYIFDFGIFIFDDRFLQRFLENQPQYELGVSPIYFTLRQYNIQNRRIYAQQLFMEDAVAESLLFSLIENYRPENRVYRYNHYTDNCTTRVRDIIDLWLGGALRERFESERTEHTFRSSGAERVATWPVKSIAPIYWLAINLIQGASVDHPISGWERMFLPDELMVRLDQLRREKAMQDKIGPIQLVLPSSRTPQDHSPAIGGFIVLGLIYAAFAALFFGLPAWRIENRALQYLGALSRKLHHLGAGLCGTLLLFFWFGTNHVSMDYNWNALTFLPLLALLPLAEFFLRRPRFARLKERINFALLIPPAIVTLSALVGIATRSALAFALPALAVQALIWLRYQRLLERGS